MVGSPVTGAGRGHRLQSDATLTYSLTTRMLDAAFTDIRNMDTQEAHSVPSVGFTGVPVDEQGRFEDGITGGSDNEPWIQGNFYGPEHDATAGVFRKSHIVGAFGAKQQ